MPTNIVIASDGHRDERRRRRSSTSGGRNAGTPFDTASTPVIAVQPLANAVSSRNVVSGSRAGVGRQRRIHRHDAAGQVAIEARAEQREDR